MTATLTDMWNELVTVALLGTDRRDPPELPPGPLADTVADAQQPTPQGRLLAAVATTVVARRCGATPLAPVAPLLGPDPDTRALLPAPAVARWTSIVANWPLLEAEWLAVAAANGWRPAPDVLVALLRRHQRNPVVADATMRWGGSTSAWLVDHLPELAPRGPGVPEPGGDVGPLPVPAELERLLTASAGQLAAALVAGLASGEYRWSHRAVLLHVVVRVDATSLQALVAGLTRGRDAVGEHTAGVAPVAMWEALIELATVRAAMLSELRPPNREEP